uniref:P21-activated protein kinase-interacting protein 1-like n=1 Tax=Denticeps clupeoides TaxID=299321 RepID=A0AAY4DS10_9TELE
YKTVLRRYISVEKVKMGLEIKIIAGSYEQITFGYRVRIDGEDWKAEPDFTHHAHTACLSALTCSDRFLATGSKDETIQLYDLRRKSEHGSLLHHDGSITCLEFYGSSHLLSGAEDGLLCVWSTKKWESLKSIKAHRGHVTSLSVHPSGKLALTVGTDKTLRTWNLIDGRSAFIKNIKENAHIVMWSSEGDKYVVVVDNKVDVYNLETASVTGSFSCPSRISSIRFLQNSHLAVAGDDEVVRFFNLSAGKCVCEFKAHKNRVKAIDTFPLDDALLLVTASNDGFIKMWKVHLEKISEPPALLLEVNTTARLTCLTIFQPGQESAEEPAAPPSTSSGGSDGLPVTKSDETSLQSVSNHWSRCALYYEYID